MTVAEQDGSPVGIYGLRGEPPEGELAHLFVEPSMIGRGVGGLLWDHMVGAARALGFEWLRIESDPGAESFYRSRGAQVVGSAPSGSIPERRLPLLRLQVPCPS